MHVPMNAIYCIKFAIRVLHITQQTRDAEKMLVQCWADGWGGNIAPELLAQRYNL